MVDSLKSGPFRATTSSRRSFASAFAAANGRPGSLIPSERELCEQYGISRMTARQSISELVTEGLLYREQGKGTFVGRPKIAQQLLRLTGFTEDMRAREQRPGAKVLTAEMWPADEAAAERLRIKIGPACLSPAPASSRRRRAAGAWKHRASASSGCERLHAKRSRTRLALPLA